MMKSFIMTLMNNVSLPIIYQYLVGAIIFLIGIFASSLDKQWRKSRSFPILIIILILGFLYYFILQGFFQFFAPYLHFWGTK